MLLESQRSGRGVVVWVVGLVTALIVGWLGVREGVVDAEGLERWTISV